LTENEEDALLKMCTISFMSILDCPSFEVDRQLRSRAQICQSEHR